MDKTVEVAEAVEAKLREIEKVPYGPTTGRRLEMGGMIKAGTRTRLTPAESREMVGRCLTEVATRVGLDFFKKSEPIRLEQFVVMSITQNDDTGGLLRSLINSFMDAYSNPETNRPAYECLLMLEALRRTVETQREFRAAAVEAAGK